MGWTVGCRRRSCVALVAVAEIDGLARAGIDDAQIGLIEFLRADDVRHHDEDDVVILDEAVARAEDVLEDGNGAEAGDAGPVLLLLLVLDAAEDAGLALAQADGLVDDALRDDGLGDAADGLSAALGGDFDFDLERDVVVVVDAGRHLDIDADVLILELGIDQRADQRRGSAGLIRAGGDGNARADFHGGFLVVGGADARALQNLGVVVGEQKIERGRTDADGEISGVEVGQIVERGRGGGAGECRWWWNRWCVELQELVAAQLGCRETPMLLGQEMPRVRSQFLLTSRTAMSTTTSPRALSRSSMSCCARRSSSGVPRMTMAFWLCTP